MFKEWDRVIVDDGILLRGFNATVLGEHIPPYDTDKPKYCIRADSKNVVWFSHDCDGLCEDGYGLFANEEDLTLITNKEQPA